MTDEELAEDFANSFDYTDNSNYENNYQKDSDKIAYESYLAGLKASRPQWHDLKKDSSDLPKNNAMVLTRLKNKRLKISTFMENKFTIWNKDYDTYTKLYDVIAWCEIPKFKE